MRATRLMPAVFGLASLAVAGPAVGATAVWGSPLLRPLPAAGVGVTAALQPGGRLLIGYAGPRARPTVMERAGRAARWGTPVRLPSAAAGVLPHVALNASGAALAVWRARGAWTAAERPPGGRWQAARTLMAGTDDIVGVALSDTGIATVVLKRCPSDGFCDIAVLRRRGFRTAWRTPVRFTSAARGAGLPYVPDVQEVAVGRRGDVVLGLRLSAVPVQAGVTRLPVSATAWAPIQAQPLPPGAVGSDMAVAADATGRAAVVWSPLFPDGLYSRGQPTGIQARLWPVTGAAAPVETVAATTEHPGGLRVGLADGGGAAAAWTTDNGNRDLVATARSAAGTWPAPQVIVGYEADEDIAAGAVDLTYGGGTAFLLWARHNGPGDNSVGTAQLAAGATTWNRATFQDVTLAGTSTGYDGGPGLAVASDGSAVAVSNGGDFGLALQDYAANQAPDPTPQRPVAQKRGAVWTVRFRLAARATVSGSWSGTSGRSHRIGPVTLGPGVHRLTLRASRPAFAQLQGCVVGRGCSPLTTVR